LPTETTTRRLSLLRPAATSGRVETFAEEVRRGLTGRPKTLPCRYFYDEEGSRLFERICELPEYYLTRAEDEILRDHAAEMVDGWMKAPALVELGSGSSTKTRRLIAAALARYGSLHYLPIDVSPTILEASAETLVEDFEGLRVTGVVADYRDALGSLAGKVRGPKLVVFLGSSLGNYEPDEAVALLAHVARCMHPGDRLLLGVDLAKGRDVLEAAYDDAQGVSAAFNKNILTRINAELDADFDLDAFGHRATYREDRGRVEMHLVSRRDQSVGIGGLDASIRFAQGETIHTENSHKYTGDQLDELSSRAGFVERSSWADAAHRFKVQLWEPQPRTD